MKDRVEAYRRDVRRGVNPFEGAFPLWRNEQFVAAVVDAFEKTPGDPGRLATFAETERAVLLEAQRRELRLLNQRDARERGEDTEAERATCTAIAPTDALKAGADETRRDPDDFTSENCTVAQSHENDALAAGLGEDDGEEVEVEGDVAVEEGLRLRDDAEDEDEDERALRTTKAETSGGDEVKESAPSDPAALRDPFLVAAAEAAAGGARPTRKSLQLGRRWYAENQYDPVPTSGEERPESRKTLPGSVPAGGAGAPGAGATRGDSGGSGAGGSARTDSGSGEAAPARPLAAFTRPPRLILYPDGSMGEAPVPGAAASGDPLEASAAAPPPGFQLGGAPGANPFAYHPFAYPAPWGHAQVPGGHMPPMFAAAMPPNAMAFLSLIHI